MRPQLQLAGVDDEDAGEAIKEAGKDGAGSRPKVRPSSVREREASPAVRERAHEPASPPARHPQHDIYGQSFPAVWPADVVCPRCGHKCSASRFANHLGKCYGKGRAAARKAGNKNNGIGGANGANRSASPQTGLDGAVFDLPAGPLVPSAKGARTKKKAGKSGKAKGRKAGALWQDPASQDLPFVMGSPGEIIDPFGEIGIGGGKGGVLLDDLLPADMNAADIGDFQLGARGDLHAAPRPPARRERDPLSPARDGTQVAAATWGASISSTCCPSAIWVAPACSRTRPSPRRSGGRNSSNPSGGLCVPFCTTCTLLSCLLSRRRSVLEFVRPHRASPDWTRVHLSR